MTSSCIEKLNEGKTKIIYPHSREGIARVLSKDDMTARNNPALTQIMEGKGAINTRTTCNIFKYLKKKGFETAFEDDCDHVSFLALALKMIPAEIVIRAVADGSYVKRFPEVAKGTPLAMLQCEYYLKTTGKVWNGIQLPEDDPLMVISEKGMLNLHHPGERFVADKFFATIPMSDVIDRPDALAVLETIRRNSCNAFEILSEKFAAYGANLIDIKFEFGFDADGKPRLGDVVTCDEIRLLIDGKHYDKEPFRHGMPAMELKRRYEYVASITDQF